MKQINVMGMPLRLYLLMTAVTAFAVYTGKLGTGWCEITAFLMLAGTGLSLVGKKIPFIGKWCGGDILFPFLMGSVFVYLKWIPQDFIDALSAFIKKGFIDFFVSAVIIGSVLSVPSKQLRSIMIKIFPCLFAGMTGVLLALFAITKLSGQSILEGVYLTGLPAFCGGSTGAFALPGIYNELLGDTADLTGRFIALLNISNILCVLTAAVISALAKKSANNEKVQRTTAVSSDKADLKELAYGAVNCCFAMTAGSILFSFFPFLNKTAWSVLLALVVQMLGVIPEKQCREAYLWEQFMVKSFLPGLLLGIGITSIDLASLVSLFSLHNLVLYEGTILCAVVFSGACAKFTGMNPVDAMIGIGCNLGVIGGSGSLTVLSVTNRMDLMPQATITCRIGGAIMLMITSSTVGFFI